MFSNQVGGGLRAIYQSGLRIIQPLTSLTSRKVNVVEASLRFK
ncbi:MAG: hypothetical protein QXO32_02980 [Candidatus Bathyarchaeia archaeon]